MLGYVAALLIATLCAGAAELQIFAAASLTQALREIGTNYTKQGGEQLRFNFGASSLLARQIEAGAPADLFFSADAEKMDKLEKEGMVMPETRKVLLSNRMVIVVARDSKIAISSPNDLAKVSRLALAETRTVPAGIYARKYLETIGLWNAVSRKVVPTENVRGALSAVVTGNVEAAIVYQTDAAISDKVRVAFAVPSKDTPDIVYPAAIVKGTQNLSAAKRAMDYLNSPAAAAVYRKHGFIVLASRE